MVARANSGAAALAYVEARSIGAHLGQEMCKFSTQEDSVPEKTSPANKLDLEAIDAAAGARIRDRRRALGITQGELARRLGLSFQQIQKYERGANRVSGSRLVQIAAALGISVRTCSSPEAISCRAMRVNC